MTGLLLLAGAMGLAIEVAVLALLVALSALLSAAESALLATPARRRMLANVQQDALERLLARPNKVYVTILVGNYIVNVSAAIVTVSLALTLLPERTALAIAGAIATAAFLLLALGEFLPRAMATVDPIRTARFIAPPLGIVGFFLAPFVWLFERFSAATMKLFGAPTERRALLDEDELREMVERGTAEGILEKEEGKMIEAVIEFGETTAGEVMVPRTDMAAVEESATLEEIIDKLSATGFSRMPVYRDDLDGIVGVVYSKDALAALHEGKAAVARDLMRQPLFVPETVHLDEVLREMRARRLHIAIVHDEFGGTAGLITLEDILEEIVGDIFDEYDLGVAEPVEWLSEGVALLDARMDVEVVNETLGTNIPEEEGYETLGGYLFHELGRPGRPGEVLERGAVTFKLERVANRRILQVRAERAEQPEEPGYEGAE